MVKRMFRKLKSRRGESLLESLVAILIFTLASIAMYSMVTAAADINLTVKEAEKVHEQQMLIAEQGEGSYANGTVTMTMTVNGSAQTVAYVPVRVYGAEGDLFSYYAAPAGGAGG